MDATVSDFVLLSRLGRGATAEVWDAVHRPSGERAALKVLAGAVDRVGLLGEIDAVGRLDHPNVVRLWEMGTTRAEDGACVVGIAAPGLPWIAMERMGGGTLAEAAPSLDWAGIRDALRAMLLGLAHAHARGVTHRDVKPSNVLRSSARGEWALSDLGIARIDGARPRIAGVSGTPGYMAPEQRAGDWRREGPHTDLWATGAVAWALCVGLPPTGAPFRPRLAVPAGLEDWLLAMLAPEPADRPAHAADALAALEILGPPSDVPREAGFAVAPSRPTDGDTIDVDGVSEPEPAHRRAERPPGPVLRPARPARVLRPPPPGALGLALLGRRPAAPPEVPGAAEAAWALLGAEGARLVVVVGPEDAGGDAWIDAFCRDVAEAGAAVVLDLRPGARSLLRQLPPALAETAPSECWAALDERATAGPDDRRAAAARIVEHAAPARPVVVRVDAASLAPTWAACAGAGRCVVIGSAEQPADGAHLLVRLEPRPAAEVQAALRAELPLSAGALAGLVERSGGYPGRALARLVELARRGRLVPSPAGFELVGEGVSADPIPPLAAVVWALGGDRVRAEDARAVLGGAADAEEGAAWLVREGLARHDGDTLVLPGLAARDRVLRRLAGEEAAFARAWLRRLGSEAPPLLHADLLLRSGDVGEALPAASAALFRAHADTSAAVALAALLESRGGPVGAALADAWRADVAAEAGDAAGAEAHLRRAQSQQVALVQARCAVVRAQLARNAGSPPDAFVALAEEAFAAAGDVRGVEGCRLWKAELASDGLAAYEAVAAEATDPRIRRVATRRALVLRAGRGERLEEAASVLGSALRAALSAGDLAEAAQLLNALGTVHRQRGDEAARREVFARGCALAAGMPHARGIFALNLGMAEMDGGDPAAARSAFDLAARVSPRADVRGLAELGRACCAVHIDGSTEALEAIETLPSHALSTGLVLSVVDLATGDLRERLLAHLRALRPILTDRALQERVARVLGD